MQQVFGSLAIILGLAAVLGLVARAVRQPVVLGYILAGVGVSALGLTGQAGVAEVMNLLGRLGVTFLLFLVGLELPLDDLKKMGRTALVTGIGQILITSVIGFGLAKALGFGSVEAVYLGIALTFSSTIVVVRLLSEKGELQSLHGKLAVGSLLVQDFVAIGILVALAGFSQGVADWRPVAMVVVKGLGLAAVTIGLSGAVLPKMVKFLAESTEVLFVSSVAWCLGVAAVVASPAVGLSMEIGGLLAGLALANANQHLQMAARVKPLRDFFLTLFFVSLGAGISIGEAGSWLVPAGVLSAYVLIGNPVIMMTILGAMGYAKRTAFLAGLSMGQISEFSLIVVATAVRAGLADGRVLGVTAVVGMVTMTLGSYVILSAKRIYVKVGKWLPFWERKEAVREDREKKTGHIVLFGHNRTGEVLRPALEKLGQVTVVDFNPSVVEKLVGEGVKTVYGDVADVEIYDEVGVRDAGLVVSTISDVGDNLQLARELAGKGKRPMVILTAADGSDAKRLYRAGADYVLVPHAVGGEYLAHILATHGLDKKYLTDLGRRHEGKLG